MFGVLDPNFQLIIGTESSYPIPFEEKKEQVGSDHDLPK